MNNYTIPEIDSIPNRPGISQGTLQKAGIVYADFPEPGSIEIPYHHLQGDKANFSRWRLSKVPPSKQKYHQLAGSGTRAYIPPQFHSFAPGGDVVLVEGEFKALALIDAGIKAIGLPSFGTYANEKPLPGMIEAITYSRAERVLFLGDSDTATNYQFSNSALFLAHAVDPVEVLLPRLPMDGPKGIDDLKEKVGDGFPQMWQALVESAASIDLKSDAGALAVRLLRREMDSLKAMTGAEGDKHKRRIVKMAAHCKEPLERDEIADIACDIYRFSMAASSGGRWRDTSWCSR